MVIMGNVWVQNPGTNVDGVFPPLEFQRLYYSDFFESHVLRQMHRGMLYEPPSSIATPFFVAISEAEGGYGILCFVSKAVKSFY